ncbi:unnamed protein product [Adineta ricciae]|uniref:Uncharacterized protein n=1 Tax=Adineta ricciae TaxID=249248 RepID=A0A814N2W0_ADIRI|nr:unnamed protein product [Adineta ricciae]CAF1452153.1 unnamed protein product [Adineta ricciae]
MQRNYMTTFLGFTVNDVQDFKTLRRRFDESVQHQNSIVEGINLLTGYKKNLELEQQKCNQLVDDIRKLRTVGKSRDTSRCFPFRSFLNLRHWRKTPKSLKTFFRVLSYMFSTDDFLSELRRNSNFVKTIQKHHLSQEKLLEFEQKFSRLPELSSDYIRHKSSDAYQICLWLHHYLEDEHNSRTQQLQIEKELLQLNIDLSTTQKQIDRLQEKIKTFKIT